MTGEGPVVEGTVVEGRVLTGVVEGTVVEGRLLTGVVEVGDATVVVGDTSRHGVVVVVDTAAVPTTAVGVVVVGATVVEPGRGRVVVVVGARGAVAGAVVVGARGPVVGVVVVGAGVVVVGTGATLVGVVVVVGATEAEARLVKVTSVAPAPMLTLTWPPAMSATPESRSAGSTAIAVTVAPTEGLSVIERSVPAGKLPATEQKPPGVGPAGTLTAWAPTMNTKLVPATMPVPATLHSLSWPISNELVKVTTVWVETGPSTTATVAERLPWLWLMSRAAGAVDTSVTTAPGRATSVTVAVPAGSSIAGEHAPTGTETVRPSTWKSNEPVTPGPDAALQISMKP